MPLLLFFTGKQLLSSTPKVKYFLTDLFMSKLLLNNSQPSDVPDLDPIPDPL
jgi:hypothetical protein